MTSANYRFLSTIIVLAILLLMEPSALALPIAQFDMWSVSDRGHYITLLVKGTVDGLRKREESKQADVLLKLFLDGTEKGGSKQMFRNLQVARALNQQKTSDPTFKPYEVENAFAVTLKDNGVTVPISFLLTINKDFKPSSHAK